MPPAISESGKKDSRDELRAKLRAKIRSARDPVTPKQTTIDPASMLMQMGVDDAETLRQLKDITPGSARSLLQTLRQSEPIREESDDEEAPPPKTSP